MPRKSAKPPGFKNEAEEADWWSSPQGRRYVESEFARAIKEGTLVVNPHGSAVIRTDPKVVEELMERAKQKATRAISIRVPVSDLEAAKAIAKQQRVGYQTVLKQAIREGLKRKAG